MEARRLECVICNIVFSSLQEVRVHHQNRHTFVVNNIPLHVCPQCSVHFTSKPNLVRHWRETHSVREEDLGLRCIFCPNERFPNEAAVTQHVQLTHVNVETFKDTGFIRSAAAFRGVLKQYHRPLYTWTKRARMSVAVLAANTAFVADIVRLIYLLLKEASATACKITIVAKCSYVKKDGEGEVLDEVVGIPHSSRRYAVCGQRFDLTPGIVQRALGEIQRTSENFENLRGSNWSIDRVEGVFVKFSRL